MRLHIQAVTKHFVVLMLLAVSAGSAQQSAHAQIPPPSYNPSPYPEPPQPPYNPNAYPAPPQPMPPQPSRIRDLFAGTIAAVLQTASGGLVAGLAGGITTWFARKQMMAQPYGYGAGTSQYPSGYPSYPQGAQAPQAGYSSTTYPSTAYPSSAYPSTTNPSTSYPTTAYPSNVYPTPTNPATSSPYPGAATQYPSQLGSDQTNPYPPAASYAATAGYPNSAGGYPPSPQVYDARTGQPVSGSENPYATVTTGSAGALYAGIAYEVYALAADGSGVVVNPATHVFRTGDKFIVHYRPSLPGRMEVYNVNPLGKQTLIDSANMAAGQLATLGPYQFTSTTGDEALRLRLSPCANAQLIATTRDIVNVGNTPIAGPAVQLSSCGAPTARGLSEVRSRDIQKVAVDGTTSFALDPISQQELGTGQLATRDVTIVFHHQ